MIEVQVLITGYCMKQREVKELPDSFRCQIKIWKFLYSHCSISKFSPYWFCTWDTNIYFQCFPRFLGRPVCPRNEGVSCGGLMMLDVFDRLMLSATRGICIHMGYLTFRDPLGKELWENERKKRRKEVRGREGRKSRGREEGRKGGKGWSKEERKGR